MENPIPSQPNNRKDILITVTIIIVIISLGVVMVAPYVGQLLNPGRTTGHSSSASISDYVIINITDNQNVPTPKNFDQLINVDWSEFQPYLKTNLENVAFFSSTDFKTSNELYAWVESDASSTSTSSNVWVNLSSNIVPAHGQLTIYMAFLDNDTTWSKYFGEAPTLSTTYGGHDSGQHVFPFYDNFAGNSLNQSKWLTIADGVPSYSVSDGISITGRPSNSYEHIVTQKNYTGIFQAFLVETGTNSWGGSGMALDAQLPGISGGYWGWVNSYIAFVTDNRPASGFGSRLQVIYNGTESDLAYSAMQKVTNCMSTLDYSGNTLKWENYFTPIVSSNASGLGQRFHMELWVGGDLSNTETATYQFARVITPLPDDVMPSTVVSTHVNSLTQAISVNGSIVGVLFSPSCNAHTDATMSFSVSGLMGMQFSYFTEKT